MNKILLSLSIATAVITGTNHFTDTFTAHSQSDTSENTQTVLNELQSNQSYLYYTHKDNEGYYFLDAEKESIVYVGVNDYEINSNFYVNEKTLYSGKKFIGTFSKQYNWELIGLEEYRWIKRHI